MHYSNTFDFMSSKNACDTVIPELLEVQILLSRDLYKEQM